MKEELDILRIVAENPDISQRKIAEKVGISLGQVNFLIKKCVKKGLIKIEGQTSKSIRYNLTAKGIKEKANLTLNYIKLSFGAVIALTGKITELAEQYLAAGEKIVVFGSQDEMMDVCRLALGDNAVYLTNTADRNNIDLAAVVFYWEDPLAEDLNNEKINILL